MAVSNAPQNKPITTRPRKTTGHDIGGIGTRSVRPTPADARPCHSAPNPRTVRTSVIPIYPVNHSKCCDNPIATIVVPMVQTEMRHIRIALMRPNASEISSSIVVGLGARGCRAIQGSASDFARMANLQCARALSVTLYARSWRSAFQFLLRQQWVEFGRLGMVVNPHESIRQFCAYQ